MNRNECLYPKKDRGNYVHSRFIHIDPNWKKPLNVWYNHTTKYHLASKDKKNYCYIKQHGWLSQKIEPKKPYIKEYTHYEFIFTTDKLKYGTKGQIMVTLGWGAVSWVGTKRKPSGMLKMLHILIWVMGIWLYMYVKIHQFVYKHTNFDFENFTVWRLNPICQALFYSASFLLSLCCFMQQ